MKTDDPSLRRLFLHEEPPAECPPVADLVRLAAGELEPERREAILEHLETCSLCAQEVRVARSLDAFSERLSERLSERFSDLPESDGADLGAASEPLPGPGRPVQRVRGWWAGLAAAALVVLAVGTLELWRHDLREVGEGTAGERVRAAEEQVSPPAGAALPAAPATFRWPPQVGASAYRVTLFDAAAEPLWHSPSTVSATVALPPEVGTSLEPGGAYFWIVDVEGDVRQTRLGPYELRLEPRSEP